MPSILRYAKATLVKILVLNLIITGMPSIPKKNVFKHKGFYQVLNLIITGMPSILQIGYYTLDNIALVLNLIITGMPSIRGKYADEAKEIPMKF